LTVATAYRIPDEPRPGGLAHMTVNPFWPFLCVMFAGAGLSWAWFLFNGTAMGSPTRRRELWIALGGFVGSLVLVAGVSGVYVRLGVGGPTALPYLLLIVTVWKLCITYALFVLQGASFGIYEYYDGPVQNGVFALILCVLAWRMAIAPALGDVPLLLVALS
jgi:hypothetical protein